MILRLLTLLLLVLPFFITSREAKTLDPYKVLGVDKSANQREIQKAFHKLSLKYHPDKNKNKGAQEKFAEINNAYEILSDEDKRKNYDLHGDEKGDARFQGGNFGNQEGYNNYFTSSQGNSRTFSFSFAGDPASTASQFGFDVGDVFSNLFGGGMKKGGNHHGGFSIQDVNLQAYNKQIKDQGLTWLLMFYTPSAQGYHLLESTLGDVSDSLTGAVKVGKVNCQVEKALCRDLGVSASKSARLFIHTYGSSGKGSLLEYNGEVDARRLKTFCQEHLPRISKRVVELSRFEFSTGDDDDDDDQLPQVLLLSSRKDTPAMWRVLSGLYRKRFAFFYDAEVHHDFSHPFLKKHGVDAIPAVLGKLCNGDVHVLKAGVAVKDLQSGVKELRALLESFERKNKAAVCHKKREQPREEGVPLLTASNAENLCGDRTPPLCVIGVFRSQKAKRSLADVLSALSRKRLTRTQKVGDAGGGSVSYSLLDAKRQPQVVSSFDGAGFKSLDKFVVAYKPRKGKFAAFAGDLTVEEAEKFVGSVLNGDVGFSKIRQNPAFR